MLDIYILLEHLRRMYSCTRCNINRYSARFKTILILTCMPFLYNGLQAQQCTGSLGDPVFEETFGDAGTTVKPTLGAPLPAGITTYTYYSPQTVTTTPFGPYPGQYTISNTTRGYNNTYFVDRPDHTSENGTGYCMVVDAQAKPGQFYERTITGLCAGTTFEFSAWVMNINPQTNLSRPSLRFEVVDAKNPNGAPIASIATGEVPYTAPGTWVRQAGMFQMPSTTNIILLRIYSNTPDDQGNDVAIDDIAFAACGPPFVFTQVDDSVCSGGSTALFVSVPAGSYANYFYQLQNRPIGTETWSDVGGIVENGGDNRYTFNINDAVAGYEYRVLAAGGLEEINNEKCRVASDPVELKVIDFDVSIDGPAAVCMNGSNQLNAVVTPAPGTGTPTTGYTYQWESSANGTTGWTVVSGANGATLNTGALTASRYYRVTATVHECTGNGTSQPFLVTVNPLVTATLDTVPGICQAATNFSVSYTINSGSPDKYSITGDNVPGFQPVTNAALTASPLTITIPGNLAAGVYHFNVTFSNSVTGCVSDPYPATLTVSATPTVTDAGPAQQLCADTVTTLAGNTPVSGTGTWTQVQGPNTATITAVNNPGTTVTGLIPGEYIFRWTISNGACAGSGSNVTVTVNPPLTPANAGPDIMQYNSGNFIMNANVPANGTGAWSVVNGTAAVINSSNPKTAVNISANSSATLVWIISGGVCPPSADTVVITYTSRADVKVVKTVQEQAPYQAGQVLNYLVSVTNAGPSNATNVRITDALPAGFTGTDISLSASGGATIVQNNSTATAVDVTADIPAANGKVDILITGLISADFEGNLTNIAAAVSPDEPDPDGAKDSITIPVLRQPHLDIVKRAPVTVIAGNNLRFTVTAQNTGLGNARAAVFTDIISPKLGNVSWTATGTGKVTITSGSTGAGNNVSVVADMPAGDTGKLYITVNGTVNTNASGVIENTVTGAPSETGATPSLSNKTHTIIGSTPGLVVTKTHMDPVIATAGEQISYVMHLFNNGPSDATGTVITDTVPAAVTDVRWSATAQGAAGITTGATGTGNQVHITGNIPAGSSNRIVINVTGTIAPGFEGALLNRVTADPQEPLSPAVTDQDIATVQKSLAFNIHKSGPATAIAGTQISYAVDVENQGPSDAANAQIRDIVPPGLTAVTWTASALSGNALIINGSTGSGNTVNVNADMPAGSRVRVIISGTIVPAGITSGNGTTTIRNEASIIPSEANQQAVISNEVVTTVTTQANLTIEKTGPDSARAGSNITYIITAGNEGPSDENGVKISDQVPGSLEGVSWKAVTRGNAVISGPTSGAGNNITVTGDIRAGGNNAIVITVAGTINPAFNGTVSNTAIITPGSTTSVGDTATKVTTVSRLPQPTITKTGPATVLAGDSITYSIEVGNTGTSDARQLRVTDMVPASITGVSWEVTTIGTSAVTNGASGTGNNIDFTCDIPGESGNKILVTITGKTDPAFDGAIVNTATATPSEPVAAVSSSATTNIRRVPTIVISKSGPAIMAAGEEIVYSILVKNTSTSNAQDILIEDMVPEAVEQVTWSAVASGNAAVTNGATGAGDTVRLTGNIAGDDSSAIAITVKGIISSAFSGIFRNIATARPSETGTTRAVSAIVITEVLQRPDVDITKSGPVVASSGERITYLLTVTNAGPSVARQAVITDTIPPVLTNASWTATASGGAVISSGATGAGNLLRIVGDIPAKTGIIQVSISGDIPAVTAAAVIRNKAIVIPAEPGIPAKSDTVATLIRKQPGLIISKIAPAGLYAGEEIVYNFSITNTGPSDAEGIRITDSIPAEVINPTWHSVATGGAVITAGNTGSGNLLNMTANIPAGAVNKVDVVVRGTVRADFSGQITNTAIADAVELGIAPVRSEAVTQVTRSAGLQITKTGPASVTGGSNVIYTIILTNSGPSDAENITIKDVIPAGITGVSWTATAMNGAAITSGASGTGDVLITGRIPNNQQARIAVLVNGQVEDTLTGTSITNTAVALNDPQWAAPVGDTATVVSAVTHTANLRIIKTGPGTVAAGQAVQYLLKIQNAGPGKATGVQISDILPPALMNAAWTTSVTGNVANINPASGTGNVNLTADIPADGSILQVAVTGTVSPAAINNDTILNTGRVALPAGGAVTDPDLTDNTSTVRSVVDNNPVVRISKSGPARARIGDSINYSITVTNGGSGNITNGQIDDIVPPGVSVSSWIATTTGAAVLTGPVSGTANTIHTTADIPVGNNSVMITVNGVINSSAGNAITNTATVTANTVESSSVITTIIDNFADVSVVKTGPQDLHAGEAVAYSIQVFNAGPQDADSITITDLVPPEVVNVTWRAVATGNASVMNRPVVDSVGNSIILPAKIKSGSANYITIYIAGKVSGDAAAGTFTNTVSAQVSGIVDNILSNNNSSVTTSISDKTGLRIRKSGPANAASGSSITYNIVVTNSGPSDADSISIADIVPPQVQNVRWGVSVAGGASVTGPFSGNTNTVNTTGNIPGGAGNNITITVTGTLDPEFAGSIVNTAGAAGAGIPMVQDSVTTAVVRTTGIHINKSGPAFITAGDRISYALTVINSGPANADNVIVTDTIDQVIHDVTWTATASNGAVIRSGATGSGNLLSAVMDIPAVAGAAVNILVSGTLSAEAKDSVINFATAGWADTLSPTVVSPRVISIIQQHPELEITKNGPPSLAAGAAIQYTLLVRNNGFSNALNAKIEDMLPATVSQVSWTTDSVSGGAVVRSGSTGTGNHLLMMADMPAGAAIAISITGKTDSSYTGTILNEAVVAPSEPGNTPDTGRISTLVYAAPVLNIVKRGPRELYAGDTIRYRILVTNTGPSIARNANIHDVVPAAVSSVSWRAATTGSAVINGGANGRGSVIDLYGDLPPGARNTIVIAVTGVIDPGFRDTLNNVAAAIPAEPAGKADSSAVVQTIVTGLPLLTIEKNGPATVVAGQPIQYTIIVKNQGISDAQQLHIEDLVPVAITQVVWEAVTAGGAILSIPATGSGNNISVTGSIPAGDDDNITITIHGTVAGNATGTLVNSAVVMPSEPGAGIQRATVSTAIDVSSQLRITKSGPAVMTRGEEATYILNISNAGPSAAIGAVITDLVPDVLTGITWTAIPEGTAAIKEGVSGSGNQVRVVADMPAIDTSGVVVVIKGTVRQDAPAGQVTNTGYVTAPGTGNIPQPSQPVVSTIGALADLGISKTGVEEVYRGGVLTYRLFIRNNGPSDADGATASDLLPAGILTPKISVENTFGGAANIKTSINGNTAGVRMGIFPAGASAIILITGTAGEPGVWLNTAVVNTPAGIPDADSSDNTSNTVTTTILEKERLRVVKTVSPTPGPYVVGQTLTYTISVTNEGVAGVNPVVMADKLPADNLLGDPVFTQPGQGRVTYFDDTRLLVWTIGLLRPGQTVTMTYQATITGIGDIKNTAVVSGPPAVSYPDSAVSDLQTGRYANLKVLKQLNTAPPLNVGQVLSFTITAINNGPDTGTNVIVTDALPGVLGQPLSIVTSKGTGSYNAVTSTITWQITEMAAGATETLTFTAKLVNGGDVTNTAVISGKETDVDLSDNTYSIVPVPVTGDQIFIPNIISPNGDGKNDRFRIAGLERYPGSSIFIYNRWGNQVYQNKNYDNSWDGNGLNEGTYYYILKVHSAQGDTDYKGWVELVR